MEQNSVIRKNSNMVTRVIGNETILLPIYKTSVEINCIYTLNKSASRAWELFDGKKKLADIKKQLLDEFDATEQEMDKELEGLLKDLKDIKAVV